jgi:hypothetical protein
VVVLIALSAPAAGGKFDSDALPSLLLSRPPHGQGFVGGNAKGNQDPLDKLVRKGFLHGSISCPMAILGNPGGELAVLVDNRYPARIGNKRAEFG